MAAAGRQLQEQSQQQQQRARHRRQQQQQQQPRGQLHPCAVGAQWPSHNRQRPALVPVCRASFFQDQDVGPPSQAPPPAAAPPPPPAAAEQQQQQQLDTDGADLVLTHATGVTVCVFGVEHLERQPHIGDWILANRPAAVVVETACTPEHGAEPGRAVTCRDQVQGAAGMFLRVFCQIAAALQEQGEAARAPGAVWDQAAANFNGEQLAYVAALATGAQLLHGDRPKHVTYRRLFAHPSIEDLDAAFAAEVTASYSAQLLHLREQQAAAAAAAGGGADADAAQKAVAAALEHWQLHQAALAQTAVWEVMMREREAVMLGVVDQVCSKGLLLMPGAPKPAVALVVGSAHLPGLQELWESGAWQKLVGEGGLSTAGSPVLQAPVLDHASMAAPGAGAKRGLLEAVMQLSMPEEVMDDLQDTLPPIEGEEAEARQWTFEIYNTCRMQLAALPDALLAQVCGAMPGVDLRVLLQPLRELRPAAGGPGWDPVVGMQLRALNFELSGGGCGSAGDAAASE